MFSTSCVVVVSNVVAPSRMTKSLFQEELDSDQ